MRKLIAILALLFSSSAIAQSGPPAGFFGNAPHVGGTLYLTFCTQLGWPCHDFKQEVWGDICHQTFADGRAKNYGGNAIFTRYAAWKCPGFVTSAKLHNCMGYGDGGPANYPVPNIETWARGEDRRGVFFNPEFVECVMALYGDQMAGAYLLQQRPSP